MENNKRMSSTKSKTASEATTTIEHSVDAAHQGFDKTLVTMKEGMERAAKGFETSQVKIKEQVEKAMKTTEEVLAFSQGNMEALMKASQIYASGFQDISKHFAASNKNSLEETVVFTKTLMSVKSVKEAVDLQTGFARSSIEKAVSETSKLTDASVKLAEQVIAPITARFALAVETFGKVR
jgi:phasin family protein